MSVTDVLKKYRDVTLQETLKDSLAEIAQYIDLKQAEAEVMEFSWHR